MLLQKSDSFLTSGTFDFEPMDTPSSNTGSIGIDPPELPALHIDLNNRRDGEQLKVEEAEAKVKVVVVVVEPKAVEAGAKVQGSGGGTGSMPCHSVSP